MKMIPQRLSFRTSLTIFRYLVIGYLFVIFLFILPDAHAGKVFFVPPFENLSKYRAISSYKTNTGIAPGQARSYTIDRYSEIPRNIIEDIIVNKGGKVVERQRIDSMLSESIITMSGLIESSKSLEVGKMLGANTLIQGTIIEIRVKKSSFSGYGISQTTKALIASLRLRVIEIGSGQVVYSKTVEGQVVTAQDNFSHTEYCDEVYDAIKSALEPLRDDNDFITKIVN